MWVSLYTRQQDLCVSLCHAAVLFVSLSVAHSPGGHAREYGKKERERKGLPESVGEERESRGRRQREKQETVQGKRPATKRLLHATKRLLQETKRHATEQDSKTARQQDSKTVEVQEVQEA